jgi:hypothetical protein
MKGETMAKMRAKMQEEMGEAQQAIGKILRHGYESRNPLDLESPNNRESLEREMGDVLHALERLEDAGDLDTGTICARSDHKREYVRPYLHHQNEIYQNDIQAAFGGSVQTPQA